MKIVITKKSVTRKQEKLYNITINMQGIDNEITVIDTDISCEFRKDDQPQDLAGQFKKQMQAVIDNYKEEQAILKHLQLDAMVTLLTAGVKG